jgi:hypothetical protein
MLDLAFDLNPALSDVGRQAAELGQLLERTAALVGRLHLAWRRPPYLRPVRRIVALDELREPCRAIALRLPAVDPAPMCSLGGQISPPGTYHRSEGWRLLSTPLSRAACRRQIIMWLTASDHSRRQP